MGTKAYFMIKMKERFCDDSYYLDAVRDLVTMPEVESVEPVSGVCDLLVKVNAPIRAVFVANKILAKEWVKGLKILRIEPEPTETLKRTAAEQLKGKLAHKATITG